MNNNLLWLAATISFFLAIGGYCFFKGMQDEKEWESFIETYKCEPIAQRNRAGKLPGKIAFLCNDGKVYYRSL